MKSLIATASLLCSHASRQTMEEGASLMQGLLARHSQLTVSDTSNTTMEVRKDATTKLMETATSMMKNGVTPDVVVFIENTISEITQKVMGGIVREHDSDQRQIDEDLKNLQDAVDSMQICADLLNTQHQGRNDKSDAHKKCRAEEALECASSRKCEAELKVLWGTVKAEEAVMRDIHSSIYDGWCEGMDPPHPSTAYPFLWEKEEAKEGPETAISEKEEAKYPFVDLTSVENFRDSSEKNFGKYIDQKEVVRNAWTTYNTKLADCAKKEDSLQIRVETCDEFQTSVHTHACAQRSSANECAGTIGRKYDLALDHYNDEKDNFEKQEFHRKREWETLHIVTCLLETVYTRIIHSIETGDPCPTEASHPDETEHEINECHDIPRYLTQNLTLKYEEPPSPPAVPKIPSLPCTNQYLWDEHGAFHQDDQDRWESDLTDLGLSGHKHDWWVQLSAKKWAGCAAPLACLPCDATPDIQPDPEYKTGTEVCKHGLELSPGKFNLAMNSFTCIKDGKCILASGRCNGINNCEDGSDEMLCDALFGPAVLDSQEECHDDNMGDNDYEFHCRDQTGCVAMESVCNGHPNCNDGSDEFNCPAATSHISPRSVSLEPTTGFSASIVTPSIGQHVFQDRPYVFDSLGSFTGYSYVNMTNDDKWTDHSHIQIKLRLQQPTTIYINKLDHDGLPWLYDEGWAVSSLEGVSYHGIEPYSRHNEWSQSVAEHHYGPGVVWAKTFTAGTVEMRGNNGGVGSYLMFLAHPENQPTSSFTMWSRMPHEPQTYQRCTDTSFGQKVVADQGACQLEAISNGHPFYSFRHDPANHGEHECVTSDSCYTVKQIHSLEQWHVYAQNDVKLGWAITSDAARVGSEFTKLGDTDAYDTYALKGGLMDITVTNPSLSGHVRLGLTTNSLDDHEYSHGRFIEFLSGGKVRPSGAPGSEFPYKTTDFITLRLVKGKLMVLKNGQSVYHWDEDFGQPTAFAKIYFKEPGTRLDVPGHQNNDPAAAYVLGDDANECRTQDVSEADCMDAVLSVLPADQLVGMRNLQVTDEAHIPPGCSVRDRDGDGDWSAFFNSLSTGNNNGQFTKVCKASRYMLGDIASNSCRTPRVGKKECLDAVRSLLPIGQTAGEGSTRKNKLLEGEWTHLPPGCSVQDGRYYRQEDGDWAAHWNSADGNGGRATGINDGGYTTICTKPPSDDSWTQVVVLSSNAKKVDLDMGPDYFNELFSKCPVVKYTRNEAVNSVYVRSSPITVNPYKLFTYRWSKSNNVLSTDFNIYDNEVHAWAKVSEWGYCNYDDDDIGYPRDCGRFELQPHIWFSMPGGRTDGRGITSGTSFEIYTGNDCPTESYDSRLTAYWDLGSCGSEGDDYKTEWCGDNLYSPDCPDKKEVPTELCASGEAELVSFEPCGNNCGEGDAHPEQLHEFPGLNGQLCTYFWHAQYRCG